MKRYFFAFFAFACLPFAGAQSRNDYDAAVGKFKKHFNAQLTDSIYNQLSEKSKAQMPYDKTELIFRQIYAKLGTLGQYSFVKEKDNLSYYKCEFTKDTLLLLVALDHANKMESFRFVPYEPEPKPGDKSQVVQQTKNGEIYGTLSVPETGKPMPVVLVIPGSGPTDRNGNNPLGVNSNTYKMLADSLYKAGIACVRYDKRGIGASADALKDKDSPKFEDQVNDAAGFIKMLNDDKRFSKVFVLGHSEGSLIGMLAGNKERIAGYISVSGPGESADRLIVKQLQAQSKALSDKAAVIMDSIKKGYVVHAITPELAPLFNLHMQPYMRSWLKYNPQLEIKKIKQPVLIIQGTTDLQVAADEAEKLNKAALNGKLVLVKGMNHVLKQAPADREKNIETYTKPTLPLSPGLMEPIVQFIKTPPPPGVLAK